MRKKVLFSWLIIILLLPNTVISANEKEIKSKISSVTVYTDRAQVSRVARISLIKGENLLKIADLPANIDANSFMVSGVGAALIKDVKIKTEFFSEVPDEKIKKITKKISIIKDSITNNRNIRENAKKQKQFIHNIITKITTPSEKSDNSGDLNPDKWFKMVDFYRLKLDAIDKEILISDKKYEVYQQEIAKLRNELNKLSSNNNKQRKIAEINIEAKKPLNIELNCSYIVYGPRWRPIYDLRVDSETKKMEIAYNAFIMQNTGEDWKNVDVNLSTAQPNLGGSHGDMNVWFVNKMPKMKKFDDMVVLDRASADGKFTNSFIGQNSYSTNNADFDEIQPIVAMAMDNTTIIHNISSSVFSTKSKYTILSDNEEYKVGITNNEYDAVFRYSTIPKLSQKAFLKAKVTNKSEYPLLAGKANIFLDNNYITQSEIDFVPPEGEFWAFLGVDDGIKVEHKLIRKYNEENGVFSKETKIIYEYLITIENTKKTEEDIIIGDQIPISNHEDIIVKLISPKYKGDTDKFHIDEKKFLKWNYIIKAGEKKEIKLKFSVEYPNKMRVNGLD